MTEKQKSRSPFLKFTAKLIIPLLFLAAGGGAWSYFKSSAPKIKRIRPKPQIPVVEVITVASKDATVEVKAMGTVIPSREVNLKSRVSGEVIEMSSYFVPGGYLKKGDTILELDASDYQVDVEKAISAVEKAQADLTIEKGNQIIAREELRLLSETADDSVRETDLLLRKPQLKKARAALASAKADLRKARLNLSRTILKAPFNALVVERNTNPGSHVNPTDTLATLVGTDQYWVEAAVPVDRLSKLGLNRQGGNPAVVWSRGDSGSRQGKAVRITGRLTEKSLMAKVIVEVPDPLGLGAKKSIPQLILGDYVSVFIRGRTLSSVIGIPRSALRDHDTVWLYQNGKLKISKVFPEWKQEDMVFIQENNGIKDEEKLIISDLSTPVEGMQLLILE